MNPISGIRLGIGKSSIKGKEKIYYFIIRVVIQFKYYIKYELAFN